MSGNGTDSMLKTFLDDSRDTLEGIEESILNMDKNPGDRESLNSLFRLVHSFKGASRFMGFSNTSEFTHRVETILDGIRTRNYEYNEDVSGILFRSAKLLNDILKYISENGSDKGLDLSDIINELEEFAERSGAAPEAEENRRDTPPEHGDNSYQNKLFFAFEGAPVEWGRILLESEKNELYDNAGRGNVWTIRFGIRDTARMKLPRVMLTMRALENNSHFFTSMPSSDYIEEEYSTHVDILLITDAGEEGLRELFDREAEIVHLKKYDLGSIIIPEDENRKGGFVPPGRNEGPDISGGTEPEKQTESEAAEQKPVGKAAEGSSPDDPSPALLPKYSTVKVDIKKMDDLMNLLGELVINRTRSEDLIQELENSVENQKRVEQLRESLNEQSQIINDIQEKVMSSRLVAVKSIFQEVSFVVRDMANRLEKEIDCRISGENTELDKRLVDSIRNPIMHIVKNAVDHGLEKPDERERRGKNREGVLCIDAHREHNQIIISIKDDGSGIDVNKIREVAIRRGILPSDFNGVLGEEEIADFLCLPGFSSREEVTGDSGRGVGMDVVRSILEEFNGNMEIHTKKNEGTQVILRLPITLAIIRGLMIENFGSRYILPISAISEVIKIKYGDINLRANGDKMIRHRDSVMRIHEFRELISGEEVKRGEAEDCFVIIIKVRGEWRGLIVESLIGEKEVVIKEVKKTFLNTRGIAGVSIMGDGSVVPVIDTGELLRTEGLRYRNMINALN